MLSQTLFRIGSAPSSRFQTEKILVLSSLIICLANPNPGLLQIQASDREGTQVVPNQVVIEPLELIPDPPVVQMLVPGFTAQALPVEIPNLNNIRYRSDGKLVALGYNGHIWLLSDEDGDGLEETAKPFWDKDTLRGPIGMALTPPGYARGQGVFVPSKGKLSLILDTDGDDVADKEIVVASGWKEIPQNVDAVGCALDSEGNIYFALGCANYANGYLVDPNTGISAFDLTSERGTVLRVSSDFSSREILVTGVRFPVSLNFNEEGDLFATDQEGATWLPNGNPFDELLHIQKGRHYGFPPRHPVHLPDVIDEPSVYDYAPQHQSACGFCFNTPPPGSSQEDSPIFGPSSWAGDALVTGQSRGKLYRTQLVKTDLGYVAQNQIIACIAALAVDVCLTPRGDLIVATHSGKPDWGTGPQGIGKLYRLSYTGVDVPQPVQTWSADSTEIHIAFDRPLQPERLKNVVQETRITQGRYVSPGDQFESMWPGYQVVHDQKAVPRYNIPVLTAGVTPDHRNIVLTTPPRHAAVNYSIELPGAMISDALKVDVKEDTLEQVNIIELATNLNGLLAHWKSADGESSWTGWLPHADLAVAKELTRGSAAHDSLWSLITLPGELVLQGQMDLWEMLHPTIQPGASLDYQREVEIVHVRFSGHVRPIEGFNPSSATDESISFSYPSVPDRFKSYSLAVATGNGAGLTCSWSTDLDSRPRPFSLKRFLLPWAEPTVDPTQDRDRVIPEIADGDWLRGREAFFSESAACAKCHRFNGLGGRLGPDLSNLVHRDYASVMKDIRDPHATINPDYFAYEIEMNKGENLSGVLIDSDEDTLTLGNASGVEIQIPRPDIAAIRPSALSLMPEGLDAALGEAGMKDLMTFLLMPSPLGPGPIEGKTEPPPPRKRSQVEALLSGNQTADTNSNLKSPFHIVLCDGPKDHGPGEHDYPLWKKRWTILLGLAEGVQVDVAHIWPGEEQFARADLIVFFNNNPGWDSDRARELDAYLARGGGAAYFHWAVEGREDAAAFARRIGLASNASRLKYRHGPIDFIFHEHPLAEGFDSTHFTRANFIDETYWRFVGDPGDVKVLASAVEENEPQPQLWTRQIGDGRVFVSVPGHYNWTFDDPVFRLLAFRGLCWAAGQPMDRLAPLVMVGARVEE